MKLNFKGDINPQHLGGFYFPPSVFLSYTRENAWFVFSEVS